MAAAWGEVGFFAAGFGSFTALFWTTSGDCAFFDGIICQT